jgi:site-specific DNA-methyltransferase (adenine-specific)
MARQDLAEARLKVRYKPDPNISVNTVHCGDAIDLMNKMQAGSIPLVVSSPPYNLRTSTGNGMKAPSFGALWEVPKLVDGYASHDDAMPYDEYVRWQRECLTAMMRVLREDGAIFYNHKWRVQDGLLQDRSEIVKGFPVRQIIIWEKNTGLNFNDSYFLPRYEVIYLICKPHFKLEPGANSVGDVWRISQETDNPHPSPFPVPLARRCIESTMADVVLDPFLGSGTTAIAAEICNRKWIGFEISDKYCKLANERIKTARKTARLFSASEQNQGRTASIM